MWGQSLSDTVTSQERPLNIQAILFPRRPTQAGSWAKTRGKGLKPVAPARSHPVDEGFDFLGQNVRAYRQRQGLDQAVVAKHQDILVQDPGNDRWLGQPDGRRTDPALEPTDQGLDHVSPLCGEQYTPLSTRITGSSGWCGAGAGDGTRRRAGGGSGRPISARRSSPLGLHRHAAEPERPGPADPVDGSSPGEDHSLCEDPERRQSLRSEVGTVPGSTVGLATGPDAGRSQSDRISLEETRGTMSWSAVNPCG